MPILTKKQEDFAFNIAVKGLTQREAWIQAGYSSNYALSIVDIRACELAAKGKIKVRINELRNDLNGPDILSKREYLAKLTRITRTKITDLQTCGADGSYIDIGEENPASEAVAEITSRTEYDKDGSNAAVITKVKLHSPLEAGRDVAKVMGWLQPDLASINDNRITNIFVIDNETKDLISKVKDRTCKLIEGGLTDGTEQS